MLALGEVEYPRAVLTFAFGHPTLIFPLTKTAPCGC
jgi:hypothetical protein